MIPIKKLVSNSLDIVPKIALIAGLVIIILLLVGIDLFGTNKMQDEQLKTLYECRKTLDRIQNQIELASSTQRYEYQALAPDDMYLLRDLNDAGDKGWQVVAARRVTSGKGYESPFIYELIMIRKK